MSVLIESKLTSLCSKLNKINTDTLLIVADKKVWTLYKKHFSRLKFKNIIIFSNINGESSKTFKKFQEVCDFFIQKGIHRNSHLLAVGGGATSDIAGYVASSLLRGISWSVVPTTLLSMVDASIGGKTGINSKYGKNLIGSFHLPKSIYIVTEFLKTLSEKEMMSGKGEIVKYCLLNKNIYRAVKKGNLTETIMTCAQYKEKIVKQDFKEEGTRAILNLGHTFGHAFEKIHLLPHGISVVLGIYFINEFFMKNSCRKIIDEMVDTLDLKVPHNINFSSKKIMSFIVKDKKKISNSTLKLILLKDHGEFFIQEAKISDIDKTIKKVKRSWKPRE